MVKKKKCLIVNYSDRNRDVQSIMDDLSLSDSFNATEYVSNAIRFYHENKDKQFRANTIKEMNFSFDDIAELMVLFKQYAQGTVMPVISQRLDAPSDVVKETIAKSIEKMDDSSTSNISSEEGNNSSLEDNDDIEDETF